MMAGVLFDKLGFMRRLETDGNFSRPQAEALSEAFHDAIGETVATKSDIEALGPRFDKVQGQFDKVQAQFDKVQAQFDKVQGQFDKVQMQIEALRLEGRKEIAELKVWIAAGGATMTAILLAAKFFT